MKILSVTMMIQHRMAYIHTDCEWQSIIDQLNMLKLDSLEAVPASGGSVLYGPLCLGLVINHTVILRGGPV